MTGDARAGTARADPDALAGDDADRQAPEGSPPDGTWFAVASGAAVAPGEITESTLDGADVVVWRTEAGMPCVMEARCPHQWSHLGGSGAVAGEEIVCLTHFWTFGTDGRGWKENLAGRRDRKGDIEVYPCREVAGEIRARRDPVGGNP